MEMTVSIYCLKRSDTLDVFYVGQTAGDLQARLKQHLSQRMPEAKYTYIQSMLSSNVNLLIELIETCSPDLAGPCERKWIEYYINNGFELFNTNALPQSPEAASLTNWLLENDLIVINRLEYRAGIPQRVLSKALKGVRPLPEKYVKPLKKILKEYGYK